MLTSNTLGRYRIIREIARSNDIVYEAVDPVMGRRVALKELQMPPNLAGAQRQERIDRFYREARAAGTLAHPGIVTIYEVGEQDGRHFIAMEYLEGAPLRDRLRQGPLPLPEALRFAIAVADALEYAHRHRVIHRDVKPDNVHLLPGGQIKLTDFGIARITFEPTLTINGQVFGTPSYMSPEQVAGKQIDARSDVFSLGVMLYEMVTGRKPFVGDSVITITYNIMNAEPPPHPTVTPALAQVLRRALAKEPAQRFGSAAELAQALRNAAGASGAAPGWAPVAGGAPAWPAAPTGTASQPPPAAARPPGASPPPAPAAAPGNPLAHLSMRDFQSPWTRVRRRRAPLLSANARWLLAWLGIWVAIGALVAGFVYLAATAWDRAYTGRTQIAAAERLQAAMEAFNERDYAAARGEWLASANDARLPEEHRRIARRNAATASLHLGLEHQSARRFSQAEGAFREAVRIDPEEGLGYRHLGRLAHENRDYPEAVNLYGQAIQFWQQRLNRPGLPDDERRRLAQYRDDTVHERATSLYADGLYLQEQGRYPEAERRFAEVQRVAPNSAVASRAREAQRRLPPRGVPTLQPPFPPPAGYGWGPDR